MRVFPDLTLLRLAVVLSTSIDLIGDLLNGPVYPHSGRYRNL